MDVLDFLRSDGSIVVNKKLAHKIGLNEAVTYSELISLFKYWSSRGEITEDGYFFCTYKNLAKNTAIKEKTLQRTTNRLVELNLIEKKQKGLPSKTHYKITDGIYDFLNDVSNKVGQNVQPDNIKGYDDNNDEEQLNSQVGQNVRTSKDKMSIQGKSNCPTNNTNYNNTNYNNTKEVQEEELIKEQKEKHVVYDVLSDYLKIKGIDRQTINKTIAELVNKNVVFFTRKNMQEQFYYMMEKINNGEVNNHNGFAAYFSNGIQMRAVQSNASKQHKENQEREYEEMKEVIKKRDTSFYYNWLEEDGEEIISGVSLKQT